MAKKDVSRRYVTCENCRPSEWAICTVCGKHRCTHRERDCHRLEATRARVVPTYSGEYSVRVQDNRGSFSTQSSPGYYRRKEAAEYTGAIHRAGLTGHVIPMKGGSYGTDWHGRRYWNDGSYFVAWIETAWDTEREDRQAFADALKAVRLDALEAAMALDRESYERKETYARLVGLL